MQEDGYLLAQGLTNKLPSMEHHEQAVLPCLSTRCDSLSLLQESMLVRQQVDYSVLYIKRDTL